MNSFYSVRDVCNIIHTVILNAQKKKIIPLPMYKIFMVHNVFLLIQILS